MVQDTLAAAAPVTDAATYGITTFILAAGGLGTAAFGIVEASKWLRVVGEAGFGAALRIIGGLTGPLAVAYGAQWETLLRAQYRGDLGDLRRLMRQGVRVGLTPANAPAVAQDLGSLDGAALADAVSVAMRNATLTDAQRAVIGRYELAADARVDAALTVAQADYTGTVRILASVVAIAIALVVGWKLAPHRTTLALLLVIAAVPLAPIAKDVAAGIQAATRALKARA
jgi:hypothetical protein